MTLAKKKAPAEAKVKPAKQAAAAKSAAPAKRKLPPSTKADTDKAVAKSTGGAKPGEPQKRPKLGKEPSGVEAHSQATDSVMVVETQTNPSELRMEYREPDLTKILINGPKPPLTDPNIKWHSMEHRGVIFYPRYEPHGKPLLFKVSKKAPAA